MKFTATEQIAVPIETAFEELTDFPRFERMAIARGAQVERLDNLGQAGVGMKWRIGFHARGKDRVAEADLVQFRRPTGQRLEGKVGGMEYDLEVFLRVIDTGTTEVSTVTNLRAKSLQAKVILQSMKLARTSVSKRYRKRFRSLMRRIERDLAPSA